MSEISFYLNHKFKRELGYHKEGKCMLLAKSTSVPPYLSNCDAVGEEGCCFPSSCMLLGTMTISHIPGYKD